MDRQSIAQAALASMVQEDERRREFKRAALEAKRRWHLVQISERAARLAVKHLTELGFGIYQPVIRTFAPVPARKLSHAQRRRRHLISTARLVQFFPGYRFVHFDREHEPWHDIFRLVHVYGVACENNQPKAVPDAFIDGMRAREIDGAIPDSVPIEELPFKLGGEARIKSGPLVGFQGPIARIDDAGRISLLIRLLGSVRPVTFSLDQLEPAT